MHFERQMVDTGEPDKRLLVVESEFGGVLQQTGRDGNILSSVLRQAWDGKPLRILARSNKDNCQEPHIALIGNVTVEELKRLLTTNDRANGFGNRILWCCARRSKLLSRGGRLLDERVLEALAARVRNAVQAAQAMRLVNFDEEAFTAWDNLYPKLTEGASGLFGAMTGRGEAQVVRLSTLYALLDGSDLIRIEHLMAAQEVWGYCEESVRYIFGDVFGDETADAIMKALRNVPEGMTQTEINRSFGGHKAPGGDGPCALVFAGQGPDRTGEAGQRRDGRRGGDPLAHLSAILRYSFVGRYAWGGLQSAESAQSALLEIERKEAMYAGEPPGSVAPCHEHRSKPYERLPAITRSSPSKRNCKPGRWGTAFFAMDAGEALLVCTLITYGGANRGWMFLVR